MIIWGITAMTHDASLCVLEDGEILFASQAERYSKKKFDPELNDDIVKEALLYGKPDVVAFYENCWKKKWRQLKTGYWRYFFDTSKLPHVYLRKFGIKCQIVMVDHHLSHAAAGYFTSPFNDSAVVVIDSVGESQTVTIWQVLNGQFELRKQWIFPVSVGLMYSAFTKRCGLKPNDEEFILMGMSAYGEPIYETQIIDEFLDDDLMPVCSFHKGIRNWLPHAKKEDLAASIQSVCQRQVLSITAKAFDLIGSKNLVYMGGVALNCLANSFLQKSGFENIWIMPNPGDAGSSLGAASYVYGSKVNWTTPYLGTNIDNNYDPNEVASLLSQSEIVGLATGRSEFGPRALGNRSLIADPRCSHAKDCVNEIKKRQKFRPFAPAIMEEHLDSWFESYNDGYFGLSPYMQYVMKCKRPNDVPAICHVDQTSRVQTVNRNDNPLFYSLLESFYEKTGCPMVLNTSLNIRGKPMVNDVRDARLFSDLYGVRVFGT